MKYLILRTLLILATLSMCTPIMHVSAAYTDDIISSGLLRRVLHADEIIRTNTGNSLKFRILRGKLLTSNSFLEPFMHTWNIVPTTDRTLSYTLGLQEYRLSCEISSMRTVFFALGYPRSEDSIIAELPQYRAPYDSGTDIWGDPDVEFVGFYTGSEAGKTGYGIYENGIARYFEQELGEKIPTLKLTPWNDQTRPQDMTAQSQLTSLLTSLDQGGHVILWGDWCTDPQYEDGILGRDKVILKSLFPLPGKNTCKSFLLDRHFSWKTPNGKRVQAYNEDHVFVLLGYIGNRESPSHIIVWDTDTGRHIYPINEWIRKWSMLSYRSLLIEK